MCNLIKESMKLNKYFMLGLAGLAFAACSNEEDAITGADSNDKTMIVSIAGIGAETKASTPAGEWTPDNNAAAAVTNINSLSLLFTDANGVIKYKYEGDKTGKAAEWNALFSTAGVKFIGLSGVTQVHAVANVPTGVTVPAVGANISALTTINFALQGLGEAATKAGVVYLGSDTDITPLNQEPATATQEVTLDGAGAEGNFYYTANVNLVPIVSRIQINSINIQTSGSTTFANAAGDDADYFTLSWSNFQPTLHGVYLNNFAPSFNGFAGTTGTLLKNDSYVSTITNGQWLFGTPATDYAADAAYISYTNSAYGALLNYGTESAGTTPLTIPDDQCIAFNIFVPFNPTTGTATTIANPTIHFQFDKTVSNYSTNITKTGGGDLTDEEKTYVNTATTKLAYTLPTLNTGYLFANISKLLTTAGGSTEITLAPGKIYNMDVTISPVNMTIDLNNPQTYNVVVAVTVEPFSEATIYPGLD